MSTDLLPLSLIVICITPNVPNVIPRCDTLSVFVRFRGHVNNPNSQWAILSSLSSVFYNVEHNIGV